MLAQAVKLTKPDGLIVYATCSLEPEEGEAQLAPALQTLPISLVAVGADELPSLTAAIRPDGTVRTLPFHMPMEDARLSGLDGFFIARFRKR
jgi:16S rRNA (cytosine967-C5)-methyltransferase